MLQRKQTIWALLAIICAVLTFKFSFYSGNVQVGANGHVFMTLRAVPTIGFGNESASSGSVLILVVTSIILAGALINLFNYRQRQRQIWITIGLIVLALLNIFLYWRASGLPHFVEGSYGIGALFSLAIPVLFILSAKGIRQDQKLVKSADRLR